MSRDAPVPPPHDAPAHDAPPPDAVAAVIHPDPYPFYAALRAERPFDHDGRTGQWVAADAATVEAVLAHPACRVRPPSEPVPTHLVATRSGAVFGRLARMTDGAMLASKTIALG